MVTQPEVWNLVVLQLWELRCPWDNQMPFGQFDQSHRSLWFILCLWGRHKKPSYQWDLMWALSHMGVSLSENPGGKIHRNWVGSSHEASSGGPLPWTLPRNWDELRDGTLHLPCWSDIHTPAHISSIGYKGEWNPIPSDPLSLASFPSPSARQEDLHGPRALGLVPHLTLK